MDLTFNTEEGVFNYRVCAIIIQEEKLLAVKTPDAPYFFLPGGRVRLHEPAEEAILREIREELDIQPKSIRPLWLNQGFFTEDVTGKRFHEICVYYLVDADGTGLFSKGNRFTTHESAHDNYFEWIPFSRLQEEYIYPLFIKEKIFNLPEEFTILTEYES